MNLIHSIEYGFIFLALGKEIDFVTHDPSSRARRTYELAWRRGCLALGGVDHPQHQVRACSLLARAPYALALDRIVRLPDARGVEHLDGIAAEIEMHLEHIPRGSGKRRDDRRLAPRQTIEQCRFARVRRPRDGNAQALAQPLALPCARFVD